MLEYAVTLLLMVPSKKYSLKLKTLVELLGLSGPAWHVLGK